MNTELMAISPIDGRYQKITAPLRMFFSEFALQKFRTLVELRWLKFLANELKLFQYDSKILTINKNFNIDSAVRIKEIEKITNHDVKAVEYFIREKLKEIGVVFNLELTHIFLTSEDVTNIAIALALKSGRNYVLDVLNEVLAYLESVARVNMDVPMMSHTHGQPASPTTIGKELIVFASRIRRAKDDIKSIPIEAKFNGSTGNFNPHLTTLPNIDWIKMSEKFISEYFNLTPEFYTTQTNTYLYLSRLFDAFKRLSSIFIDLNRDIWTYISMGYFNQKVKEGETGSSVMPHKVNPIDFENSEGNMEIAEGLFELISRLIQRSRLQRDLSDSTLLRNNGVPFAHFLIGLKSILRGLKKLEVNKKKISADLSSNPQLLGEAIQSMARFYGEIDSYEKLKNHTRGKTTTPEMLQEFIDTLTKIPEKERNRLKALTTDKYTGEALRLVKHYFENQ